MSLVEDVRHDSRTNPSTCKKIKYSKRNDTPGSCLTGDHRWSATRARLLAPHRIYLPGGFGVRIEDRADRRDRHRDRGRRRVGLRCARRVWS